MNRSLCTRAGFGRIDVLVLVGIGVLLLAMTVPAVQNARESAARVTCANHLKQLALAAHQYNDAHISLPPGWWTRVTVANGGVTAGAGAHNGPFPQLLPYLGAKPLYDKLRHSIDWDPRMANADPWYTINNGTDYNYPALEAAATPFTFMQCPADYDVPPAPENSVGDATHQGHPRYTTGGWTVSLNKGGKAGDPKTANAADATAVKWGASAEGEFHGFFLNDWYDHSTDPYRPFGRVNYLPIAGLGGGSSPFYAQFEGVFADRTNLSLAAIGSADGTSRTLMFGETSGQFYPGFGENALQENLFGAVGKPTMRGLQQRCAPEALLSSPDVTCDSKTFSTAAGQKARYSVFSSSHPAGVQFAFCDGSVRMIRRAHTWVQGSPDWYVLQELAGFHDGFHRDTGGILP